MTDPEILCTLTKGRKAVQVWLRAAEAQVGGLVDIKLERVWHFGFEVVELLDVRERRRRVPAPIELREDAFRDGRTFASSSWRVE